MALDISQEIVRVVEVEEEEGVEEEAVVVEEDMEEKVRGPGGRRLEIVCD